MGLKSNFFDNTFSIISIFIYVMFIVAFVIVIGTFIYIFVNGTRTQKKNDNSPRMDTHARIVTKRIAVYGSSGAHTVYYATFEFNSGDRQELYIPMQDFGILAEGDVGMLTFQGTRYLSFRRQYHHG